MRYLAILKDSFREARDSKVLLVLLVLSTLIILFVATLSFKPLSAEKTMQQFVPAGKARHGLPIMIALNNHKPEKLDPARMARAMNAMNSFRLDQVDLIHGDEDDPQSTYALTITQTQQAGDSAAAIRSLFQDAVDLDYLTIETLEALPAADKSKEQKFRVTLKGSRRMLRIWAASPSLFFGAIPLGELMGEFSAPLGFQLYFVTSLVLSIGAWIAVLVGVIITSFFIPNMLRKGTVDLLLVKPIHRWALLIYKYLGGLMFIFASTSYAMVGIWLVLGIRTGVWVNWSLTLILTITFFFAILYAVSTFIAVLTRSTVTAIMVTIGAWFAFYVVGSAHQVFENRYRTEQERDKVRDEQRALRAQGVDEKNLEQMVPDNESRWGNGPLAKIAAVVHLITPRTTDLNVLNDLIVYTDFMTGSLADMSKFNTTERNWSESLAVSLAWIAIFLGLACLWFSYKDY